MVRAETVLAITAFLILASVSYLAQPSITGLQVACEGATCGDGICQPGCENECPSDCINSSAPPAQEVPGFLGLSIPSWDEVRPLLENQNIIISAAATLLFLGVMSVLLLRMRKIQPIKNPRPPIYSLIITPPRPEIPPAEIKKVQAEKQTMQIRHEQKLQHREQMFTPFEHRPPPPESALMRELRSLPSFEDETQRRKAIADLSRLAKPSIVEQRKR